MNTGREARLSEIFVDPEDSAEAVLRRTDQAMYRAKGSGRGRYEVALDSAAPAPRGGRVRVTSDGAYFVAVAAHELQTPLSIVAGVASTLREGRRRLDESDVDELLDALVRQADRMRALVDQLLDLSRAASREAAPRERVVLADAVADALTLAPPPESTRVRVVERVPALAVSADAMGLGRVLVNLLTNAYRYGGPEVVVELHREGERGVVTVSDDGDGVPPDLVARLFEPFARGSNGNGQVGSGLGLALSRSLVESWGGDLTFAAVEAGGSRFDVRLALAGEAS